MYFKYLKKEIRIEAKIEIGKGYDKWNEMKIVKKDQDIWNMERKKFDRKSKWIHWAILKGKPEYYMNYEDKKEGSGVMEVEWTLLSIYKRVSEGAGQKME